MSCWSPPPPLPRTPPTKKPLFKGGLWIKNHESLVFLLSAEKLLSGPASMGLGSAQWNEGLCSLCSDQLLLLSWRL